MSELEMTAVESTDDAGRWNAFVRTSPHQSSFVESWFLEATGHRFRTFLLECEGRDAAGAVVMLDETGKPWPGTFPGTMYQGLLLSPPEPLPRYSRPVWEQRAFEGLLQVLEGEAPGLTLNQHWRCRDVRGLSWWNYHEPARPRFQISPAFTGVLPLAEVRDATFTSWLSQLRHTRVQEFRKASGKVDIVRSSDVDLLDRLHKRTFERQGVDRGELASELLVAIAARALENGRGELHVAMVNGSPASATLFLTDDRASFYLYGANEPELRSSGASTFLMLEAIRRFADAGLQELDFVGVNSPSRGFYKTSFNAEVQPYFVATLLERSQ